MPRMIKTLYPCRHCGVPAQVSRRSYAEHAVCPLCATRGRFANLAQWADERGIEKFKKGNRSTADSLLLAIRLAPSLEDVAAAAADGLVVAQLTLRDPAARASWIRWAHNRMQWVEDCSQQLREMTAGLRTGFTMIAGGLAPLPETTP